jgi:DHA1 family tetracycline resistance protein-like MFS transporter
MVRHKAVTRSGRHRHRTPEARTPHQANRPRSQEARTRAKAEPHGVGKPSRSATNTRTTARPTAVPEKAPATAAAPRSALFVVCLAVFVDMLGFGIILPSLPYRAEHLGGAGVWVGAILTAYAVAQFVAAPVLGTLSDRYGRRRILLLSLAGSAISLALSGVAGTLVLLLLARFVAGGFGGSIAVGQAYAVDLSEAKDRTRALGMVGAAIGLGFVFGPGIGGGFAAGGVGFTGICLVASALAAVNLLLGLRLLPRTSPAPALEPGTGRTKGAGHKRATATSAARPRRYVDAAALALRGLRTAPFRRLILLGEALRLRSLRPILISGFAATFAFAGMETTFALLGSERFHLGAAGFGAVFAGVGVVMALVQGGLVGRLADRFGDRMVAVGGAAALAAGLVVLPFVPAWLAYAALAVVGVGQGLLTTTTASLIAVRGGHRIGGSLGVGQSANAAARALGPIVAGVAFDLGPSLPYVIGAACCLVAALILLRADGGEIAPVPTATFTVDTVH